jgi:molybdate transport system substrate-binding protein
MRFSIPRFLQILCAGLLLCTPVHAQTQAKGLTVYAASSLTNVMQDLGTAFMNDTGIPVKFSFAASSTLARQIESGAPAGAFFSADEHWMDWLEERKLILSTTRRDIATTRLVLVAPADSKLTLKIAPGFNLVAALGRRGHLITGDPSSVPVGRYAKTALTTLGVWNQVAGKVVGTENVRAALAFVARSEAPLGIVYETDARIDAKVRIVDVFPADSHPRISYPAAVTQAGNRQALAFVEFCRSTAAQQLLRKYGFTPL